MRYHLHIIITGGTIDSIFDPIKDSIVVNDYSVIPLKGFAETDASFNLGFAIAAMFFKPPGIYLAMNGQLFFPGNVRKNIEKGCFEEL